MQRICFNEGWTFRVGEQLFGGTGGGMDVTLPHDAMILQSRNECNHSGFGYYPGGVYVYIKRYFADAADEAKELLLGFEGVSQHAFVYVNGEFAGKNLYSYNRFYVRINHLLRYGAENEIKVVAKTDPRDSSRWYCGSGIYRDVFLYKGDGVFVTPDGIKVDCAHVGATDAHAHVNVNLQYNGLNRANAMLKVELLDADGVCVAADVSPITLNGGTVVTVRRRMLMHHPMRWDLDAPYLYVARCTVVTDGVCSDADEVAFGIRELTVDSAHGLRINGKTVKLRGGCIHHDAGILGAATFDEVEYRRAYKMKQAGFNAIRSAHNPVSKAMLRACDKIGLLVMDELSDAWNTPKQSYDNSIYFDECWRDVVKSMVDKDYNHPCVFAYSTGNEIMETGNGYGAILHREILAYIRALDNSRYTINAINGFFSVIDDLPKILGEIAARHPESAALAQKSPFALLDAHLGEVMSHDIVTKATEQVYADADIAGYNYMDARYESDGAAYPNRVIVGSETNQLQIKQNWSLIERLPHVIGDFCWTGWDFLGEPGVGLIDYSGKPGGHGAPYPWYMAYCGDFDICGDRRPQSYYREIAWGLRNTPYIAVCRPQHYGKVPRTTNWSWSDAIESWTWPGYEGKPIVVEVYADAKEVALYLDDMLIQRKAVGEVMPNKAVFDTVYQPGVLKAVAYRDGTEVSHTTLQSADHAASLKLWTEASGGQLVYLHVDITDDQGRLNRFADTAVTLKVEGAGVLAGYGTADPTSTQNFFDDTRTAFDGRLLAVIRRTDASGDIVVTATADGFDTQTLTL